VLYGNVLFDKQTEVASRSGKAGMRSARFQ
jgi:hypothetical protein